MESKDAAPTFDHERLEVFHLSTEVIALVTLISRAIPREDRFLRSQLLRAATSITYNIAEGAEEFSPGDKARFYRIARRSTGETAAILFSRPLLGVRDANRIATTRTLLFRIAGMLTKLIESQRTRQEKLRNA